MTRTWPNTFAGWFAFFCGILILATYALVCLGVNVFSRGWPGFTQWCKFVWIFIEGFWAMALGRRYIAKF